MCQISVCVLRQSLAERVLSSALFCCVVPYSLERLDTGPAYRLIGMERDEKGSGRGVSCWRETPEISVADNDRWKKEIMTGI